MIPLQVDVRGNTKLALAVLFAAVCLVLLIACTNVANLVLARGAARRREISVRTALGAGRARIFRQLFTENLMLAILAACLGGALAPAGVGVLIALAPPGIPRLQETHIDAEVLAFTLTIAVLSAIVFGLIPAWKISRSDPIESLKSGARGAPGSTRLRRVRSVLVADCSNSGNDYLESSSHLQVHLAAGLRLYATQHIFFQPQIDAHYVNNFFQFDSNWVPEYSASVGWSFGER